MHIFKHAYNFHAEFKFIAIDSDVSFLLEVYGKLKSLVIFLSSVYYSQPTLWAKELFL